MDEIRTTKLVVVDNQGIPRITMGVSPEGVAELAFTDTQGNERLRMAVSEGNNGHDSVFRLCSSSQGPELQLKTSSCGGSSLSLMRRIDQPLVVLEVESGEDSRPMLSMFDPSEKILLDESGKALGTPQMLLHLSVTEDQYAYLLIIGPDEEERLRLPAYPVHSI